MSGVTTRATGLPHCGDKTAGRFLGPSQGLVIAGCSRRKASTTVPVPALDLYQGGCIPQLRERFAARPLLRGRVRIVSAAHGLLRPDDLVVSYDRRLSCDEDAHSLARSITPSLASELATSPALIEVLVIAEPLYVLALAALFDDAERLVMTQVTDPHGWQDAARVLDRWGW